MQSEVTDLVISMYDVLLHLVVVTLTFAMLGALAWQVAYLNKKILFLFWGEIARGCLGSLLWCALGFCVRARVCLYYCLISISAQSVSTTQILATASTIITQYNLLIIKGSSYRFLNCTL
ncbi:hypothetical protein Hdeb2414_s0003g00085371 [Helianthus debilis subsp. tardiflorus]